MERFFCNFFKTIKGSEILNPLFISKVSLVTYIGLNGFKPD